MSQTAATLRRAIEGAVLLAAQLEAVRKRLVSTIAETDASGKRAEAAQIAYRDLLGTETVTPDARARAKKERDESSEAHADGTLAASALRIKVEALEAQHSAAIRTAAQAAEAGFVHVALLRRERYRLKMAELAGAGRDFHAACFGADRANAISSGSPGEPVPHLSQAASRLQSSPDSRSDGFSGALSAAGLAADLKPMASRIPPMTEAEVLTALEQEEQPPDATTNGLSQVQQPKEETTANA